MLQDDANDASMLENMQYMQKTWASYQFTGDALDRYSSCYQRPSLATSSLSNRAQGFVTATGSATIRQPN